MIWIVTSHLFYLETKKMDLASPVSISKLLLTYKDCQVEFWGTGCMYIKKCVFTIKKSNFIHLTTINKQV